jgi:uncharacterized protein YjbI with pentapeptide repeats
MTREDLITVLREGRQRDWMEERRRNPDYIDLRKADLRNVNLAGWHLGKVALDDAWLQRAGLQEANLSGAYLVHCNLTNTNFAGATLDGVSLNRSTIQRTNFTGASLVGAQFVAAIFNQPIFERADLRGANLVHADLTRARFSEAKLDGANLTHAFLNQANLTDAKLIGAKLLWAQMDRTILGGTLLNGAHVYGVNTWSIQGVPCQQENLVVSPPNAENKITVDDIEVAQQVYTFLDNPKISREIDALIGKVVLILGRFTEDRIAVLREIRCALRYCNTVPILFDFPKPKERDILETVMVLGGLAGLVLADFTTPKMVIDEVPRLIETHGVPVQPLLLEGYSDEPPWLEELCEHRLVLPIYRYCNEEDWKTSLKSLIEKGRNERQHQEGYGIEERRQRAETVARALKSA